MSQNFKWFRTDLLYIYRIKSHGIKSVKPGNWHCKDFIHGVETWSTAPSTVTIKCPFCSCFVKWLWWVGMGSTFLRSPLSCGASILKIQYPLNPHLTQLWTPPGSPRDTHDQLLGWGEPSPPLCAWPHWVIRTTLLVYGTHAPSCFPSFIVLQPGAKHGAWVVVL